MKTSKISLANVQNKLSRNEMKKIVAGDGDEIPCTSDDQCSTNQGYTCRRRATDGVFRCVRTTVSFELS